MPGDDVRGSEPDPSADTAMFRAFVERDEADERRGPRGGAALVVAAVAVAIAVAVLALVLVG